MLRRKRFFGGCVILLGLGIGTTGGIFSLLQDSVWADLPIRDPAHLFAIASVSKDRPGYSTVSPLQARWILGNISAFDEVGGYADLTGLRGLYLSERRVRVMGAVVSANFFRLLGAQPWRGRDFQPEDDDPAAPPVAIVSYSFWRRYFGEDPGAVGQTMVINLRRCRVVGVMPEVFRFPAGVDIWLPGWLRSDLVTNMPTPTQAAVYLFGRPRRGASESQIKSALVVAAKDLGLMDPYGSRDLRLACTPIREFLSGSRLSSILLLLIGGAAVMALACLNVANLLVIGSAERSREIAVRAALGASLAQLRLQVSLECVCLAVAGVVSGAGLAGVVRRVSAAMLKVRLEDVNWSGWRLSADAVLLAAAVMVFCGVAPMLALTNHRVESALRDSDRTARGGGAGRTFQRFMQAGQTSLSLVLVFVALLALSGLRALSVAPWGFDSEASLWFAPVDINGGQEITPDRRQGLLSSLAERAAGIPGVASAAIASAMPPWSLNADYVYSVEGAPADAEFPLLAFAVSSDYFRTMRIPLTAGRDFSRSDSAGAPCAVILNRAAGLRIWGRQAQVGAHLRHKRDLCQVVGVAGDVRVGINNAQMRPAFYFAYDQNPYATSVALLLRATNPHIDLSTGLAAAASGLDPALALDPARRFEDSIGLETAPTRTRTLLCTWFAVLALALGGVGVFASALFNANQRSRELAVRVALGATKGQIYGLVVGESLKLTCIGLAVGLIAAPFAYARLASLFFGVQSWWSAPLAVGILLCLAVTVFATHFPARRSTRLDPLVLLRFD